jgi:hypothetical protein
MHCSCNQDEQSEENADGHGVALSLLICSSVYSTLTSFCSYFYRSRTYSELLANTLELHNLLLLFRDELSQTIDLKA